ncbi:Connector enhancer of kinase suppressor of ras 3 [Melipona quadrifasciata]|uniref:Connector enhancer of kinase suppressor of ras 3 n=1 Tax=Melipona quadrifasciata TaxID=166423 RepID=A0A0M8ZV36_9HYME|nr:Connector enhancer of kinase suppressor of ras 3 [Melipona quadrifasciata]
MNFGVNLEEEHRRTLLEGTAALERSSQSIIRSQAIAIESEQIGTEVISELSEQRERLLRADGRLSQTDEELNKTRRILNVMRRRILMNKFILIIIILLEIVIDGADWKLERLRRLGESLAFCELIDDRVMAYVNVAEWKTEQVCEWLKGLDNSVLPYVHSFTNHGVNGQQLLSLRPEDLEHLGVLKLGHQEIILEAVEYLRNFHYELDRENLQLLALRLSCQAHSLQNELSHQTDSKPRDRFAEKPVEEIRKICGQLAKLADYVIQDITDPMILQPASLDLATLKKKPGDDLGFYILPSFHGAHQIAEIKKKKVNYQTVVGWERKNLLELFRESPAEVLLTLKRRPRHTKIYGQIYIKPYRLPSNKKTSYTTRWQHNLPSPRPELLTIPDFTMPLPRPKNPSPEPASILDTVNILDTMIIDSSDSDSETEPPLSIRLYSTKPRNSVQRRATITGASPTSKHGIDIEQFWKELKQEHSTTSQLRDKAASCAHGLDNVPSNLRPQTCISIEQSKRKKRNDGQTDDKKVQFQDKPMKHDVPQIDNTINVKNEYECNNFIRDSNSKNTISNKELSICNGKERGRLDKSHSTPAYDLMDDNIEDTRQKLFHVLEPSTNNVSNVSSKTDVQLTIASFEDQQKLKSVNEKKQNMEINFDSNIVQKYNDTDKYTTQDKEKKQCSKSSEYLDSLKNKLTDATHRISIENNQSNNECISIDVNNYDKKNLNVEMENTSKVCNTQNFANNLNSNYETNEDRLESINSFVQNNKKLMEKKSNISIKENMQLQKQIWTNNDLNSTEDNKQMYNDITNNITRNIPQIQVCQKIQNDNTKNEDLITQENAVQSCKCAEVTKIESSKKLENKSHLIPPDPPPRKYYSRLTMDSLSNTSKTFEDQEKSCTENINTRKDLKSLEYHTENHIKSTLDHQDKQDYFDVCNSFTEKLEFIDNMNTLDNERRPSSNLDSAYLEYNDKQTKENKFICDKYEPIVEKSVYTNLTMEYHDTESYSQNMDSPDGSCSSKQVLDHKSKVSEKEKSFEKGVVNKAMMVARSIGLHGSLSKSSSSSPRNTEDFLALWVDAINKATLGADGHSRNSALFSETDESDGEQKSKTKNVHTLEYKPNFDKSFGSLKKVVRKDSPSYRDHEISGASLDRKYLKFLGTRNHNVPVPTAQFRSYRRVLPTSTPNKKQDSVPNSPDLQMTIAGSTFYGLCASHSATDMSNNTQDMGDYRRTTDRCLNNRNRRPEDLQGFVTLEEFMLQQEDQRQMTKSRSISPRITPLISDHVHVQHRNFLDNETVSEQSRHVADGISNNDVYAQNKNSDEVVNNTASAYGYTRNMDNHAMRQYSGDFDSERNEYKGESSKHIVHKKSNELCYINKKKLSDGSNFQHLQSSNSFYCKAATNEQKHSSYHNKPNIVDKPARQMNLNCECNTNIYTNQAQSSSNHDISRLYDYYLPKNVDNSSEDIKPVSRRLTRNDGSGSTNDLTFHTFYETLQRAKKDASISRKGSFNLTSRRNHVSSDKHWLDSLRRTDKKEANYDKTRLKNVAQYQPPPMPTSPFEQEGMIAAFEMHLDKGEQVQKPNRLKNLFANKSQQKPSTLELPKETQKTLLGSPRLHRALFREKCYNQSWLPSRSNSQSPGDSEISQSLSPLSGNSPQTLSQSFSSVSSVSDWSSDTPSPSTPNLTLKAGANQPSCQKHASTSRNSLTPPTLPYIPPPTSPPPDYPGLEYPPVFEPGTYSLLDASLLRNRNKSNRDTH